MLIVIRFRDSIVIELGSGVGLVGIVSSILVKHIFCTGSSYTIDASRFLNSTIINIAINNCIRYTDIYYHFFDSPLFFISDRDADVLELCERNIKANCSSIEGSSNVPNVSVKVLNWMTPAITTHDNQRYSWEDGDMNQLKKASYIIAADGMHGCTYHRSSSLAFFYSCTARQ